MQNELSTEEQISVYLVEGLKYKIRFRLFRCIKLILFKSGCYVVISTTLISTTPPGLSNVIARRVEAMEDHGEVFDTLMSLREDKRNENDKLLGLNDLITQALKEIQAKEAHVNATNNSG
uniref:Uncharacterized protein n=1 Tax=Tanacetum cinerariifolium TaxID=118510 RepID=A0A6L2JGR2_TANCI|nr:hypothetical protein [Tanacetum cinerariifolium]